MKSSVLMQSSILFQSSILMQFSTLITGGVVDLAAIPAGTPTPAYNSRPALFLFGFCFLAYIPVDSLCLREGGLDCNQPWKIN